MMEARSSHNLPEQPNALLGRDQELKTARELLLAGDVRLLSLIGPPGVGKTRLAMAVAASVLESFPGGVWFVDLAPLQDPSLVASEIASTFGIAESHAETALDRLAACLGKRPVLLLLDNFENILQAAPWVGRLVQRTPGLKVLATSRERLRLRWERTLLVPPLGLPDLGLTVDWSTLASFPSVALFVQRATAVDAGFTLSPENAPIIATLCTRLDGLPLAIELAAARIDVLSPAEILANMDDRFRLLQMGARDLPERHQTLEGAIDWSYELLPSAMKQFLRRLSVFKGGFSLRAAEIVGESEALGVDGLASLIGLVEKSLITKSPGPTGEARFTLFESIREYLFGKLKASEELDAARRRHALHYLELAERSYSELKEANQKVRFDRLEVEHDNLRAALQWSLDAGERSVGERITAALWNFWWLRGHIREGTRWLYIFLGSDGEPKDDIHLRILEGAGTLRGWQGNFEPGRAMLMQALQIAEERQDQAATARILFRLGSIFWVNGRTEGAAWLTERVQACQPGADAWELAHAFLILGNLLFDAGQDDAAEKALKESLEHFQFAEEKHVAILAESKLALLKYRKGDLEGATEGMVGALDAIRRSIDLYVIAFCTDEAVQLVAQQMAEQNGTRETDHGIARVVGAVDHWRAILSLRRTPREQSVHQATTERLRRRLGEQSYLHAWKEGQSIPVAKVIDEATRLLQTSASPAAEDRQRTEGEGTSIALSKRERQVIQCVAEGLSNQEIAERLFITERTVRFHLTSIFNKLGANNRAQAVSIADRLGLR